MSASIHSTVTAREARAPLLAGAAAGPLYVGIGTAEAVLRDGFDIRVHSLSLLANGAGGWIHAAMLVGTGLLTVLGALGLARAFPAGQRSRGTVGGLAVFGLGVAVAGLLRADPAEGFPIGTPDGPPETISWHGVGHLVAGGIGFLGLIVACLLLARWFWRRQQVGWSMFSLVTGVFYLASFAGIASGAGNVAINLAFTAAVILGWAWVTLLMVRAHKDGRLR
jgi:Protein of unknown function (DUF998)